MIPYGRQSINEEDILAVTEVLRSDWLTTGPMVVEFERNLSEFVGSECVTVSSGTAALHAAYSAIGIEEGDEVITPPLTFIATQATAVMCGATIKFADVLPDTGCIDPQSVLSQITHKTKAIVAVDFAGHPAELDELKKISIDRGLYLIEDAAHSLGSVYRGRNVGTIADLTTFSFFPTKNITSGEGGAISSPNKDLLKAARQFSRQGLIRDRNEFQIITEGNWHQEVQTFGLNYRLPDILCALGNSQLTKLNEFKKKRREIFDLYAEIFYGHNEITIPIIKEYVDPMWHLFPIRVPANKRRRLFDFLRANDVFVQVNYLPAFMHPVFNFPRDRYKEYPISLDYYQQEISLPIYPDLTQNQVKQIGELVIKGLGTL